MDTAVLVYAYHFFDPRNHSWVLSPDRATLEAITRHGWRMVAGSGRPVFREHLGYNGLLRARQLQQA